MTNKTINEKRRFHKSTNTYMPTSSHEAKKKKTEWNLKAHKRNNSFTSFFSFSFSFSSKRFLDSSYRKTKHAVRYKTAPNSLASHFLSFYPLIHFSTFRVFFYILSLTQKLYTLVNAPTRGRCPFSSST